MKRWRPRRVVVLVLAGCLVLVGLSACAGSGNDTPARSGESRGRGADTAISAAPKPAGGAYRRSPSQETVTSRDQPNGLVPPPGRVVPGDREIVYTGEITVRVRDVAAAADTAERMARQRGGTVFGEDSSADPERADEARTTLVLRAPPAQFRPLLADLATLGDRLSQRQSSQDVTSEVVDVKARLAAQRQAVARMQGLLDRARTVGEVVQVESELSRRVADLEALEAQEKSLEDRTALATVTAVLVAPAAADRSEDRGFLAGLRRGWTAFTEAVAVGLTVLGAALPFLVAISVLGLALFWIVHSLRRTRRHDLAAQSTDAASAQSSAAVAK